MGSRKWDEFIRHAKREVDSGRLEGEQYKFDIGDATANAREAVLEGSGDWQTRLNRALKPNHPISWRALSDFRNWHTQNSEVALSALQAIWTKDDSSIAERIRAFTSRFPREATKGAEGTRTTIISALLMGLDVKKYPPFKTQAFNKAYKRTEYDKPRDSADEAELYQHALGFLDRLMKEASERELTLPHRLDAQSVVWLSKYDEDNGTPVTPPPVPTPTPDLPALAAELHLTPGFLREIETLLYEKK